MTPDQIKESRAICEAARPGKWKGVIAGFGGYLLLDVEGGPAVDLTDEDKLFISHARNILPKLLDDYEAALVKIDEMRRELREIADCPHMRKANTECTDHIHMPGGH